MPTYTSTLYNNKFPIPPFLPSSYPKESIKDINKEAPKFSFDCMQHGQKKGKRKERGEKREKGEEGKKKKREGVPRIPARNPLSQEGGDLLSRIAVQYHRRARA